MNRQSGISAPGEDLDRQREEPPPVLGSWGRLYAGVIGWLALLICTFYLFARRYAP